MRKYQTLLVISFLGISMANAQNKLVKEWWFWPDYTLDGRAKNQIGPRIDSPKTVRKPLQSETYSFSFFGKAATERIENFLPADQVSTETFTVEMWLLYHVNREVGVMAAFRHRHRESDPKWLLGLSGKDILFVKEDSSSAFPATIHHENANRGWKNYWYHVVGTYDGTEMKLYLNGELTKSEKATASYAFDPADFQLEVAGYLSNEPYMQIGDLLKCLRIYKGALPQQEIQQNLEAFQQMVELGRLYPDTFHFTAGPYLQAVGHSEVGIVWETSHPSTAEIHFGTSLPLSEKVLVQTLAYDNEMHQTASSGISKQMLTNLTPGQQYFYQIMATSEDGQVIDSGISTFKTAPEDIRSFSFCTIGDTEARPHINNRVSKLMWDERPEFLINLGDLTDGGKADNKFQWNYEYFHGMNQFISRIPVFPVAGNGEGDLHWFKKYHILGAEKGYYKFSYGNADFFMLDSNRKDDFAPGGEQYRWLEEQLQSSTAEWKFVAHHHAPYSADDDDYGNSWRGSTTSGDMEIRKIVPLYEKHGVDMVMFGHLHTYQRTHQINENKVNDKDGVLYVQAGGAGGNLEDFSPTRAWFSAKTFRGHHYLTVEVQGPRLELRMYDSEGRLKDIYQIDKTHK